MYVHPASIHPIIGHKHGPRAVSVLLRSTREVVRQSRRDTKEEDIICHHSAHCRQILSIKTPLSSPDMWQLCLWKAHGVVFVCVTSDRTTFKMATCPSRPRHDGNLLRWGRVGCCYAWQCPLVVDSNIIGHLRASPSKHL